MLVLNPNYIPILYPSARGMGGGAQYSQLLLNMEGANGATTVTDESQNAFNGTFMGNAVLDNTLAPPVGTTSLLLDGSGDYIDYGTSSDFSLCPTGVEPYCVEMISYKSASEPQTRTLAGKYGSTGFRGWHFYVYDIRVKWGWSHDGTAIATLGETTGSYTIGSWMYTCAEFDGTDLRLYTGTYAGGTATLSVKSTPALPTIYASTISAQIGAINGTSAFNGNVKAVNIRTGIAPYATDTSYSIPTLPWSAS